MSASNVQPEEDPERVRYFHAKYISYSRAVGVMWAVLSLCHLIITIVCLVQPSWLETTDEAPTAAYFGLWKYAIADPLKGVMAEQGKFLSFDTMATSKFSTIAVLIGLAVIVGCLVVLTLILSFCLSSNVIFMACGWLMSGHGSVWFFASIFLPGICVGQICAAVVMGLACVLFPTSWSEPKISGVCQSSGFDSGLCSAGKAFWLAGISAGDSVLLAVLAFILAYRQVTLLPWTTTEEEENEGKENKGKS